MNDRKTILEEFSNGDNFLLTAHINPDGDSLGSMLGLALALEKTGKKVTLVSSDPTPVIYSFLPGIKKVIAVEEVKNHFSTAIVLDCSDWKRLGKAASLIRDCKKIINIDHHVTNEMFGSLNYVEGNAAATGELVYNLLTDLGISIDNEVATNLYTALMTDTGSFRHSNTKANAFRIAADLTEKGANPHQIAEHVYSTFSFDSLKLLGKAMSAIQLSCCKRIAWLFISQELLQETNTSLEETDGLIPYLIGIQGVEVALIFKEVGEGKIKVSFRAREKIDVSKVAGVFGGGGHTKAAGCSLDDDLEIAREKVLQEVVKALNL